MHLMKWCGLFILIGLSLSGCGTSLNDLYYAQVKKAILPNPDTSKTYDVVKTTPGEIILSQPVGFLTAGYLKQDFSFEIAGKTIEINQEYPLQLSDVRPPNSIDFPKGSEFFCDLARSDRLQSLLAASTLGLSTIGSQTKIYTRTCLIDTNQDMNFDQVVLLGAKGEERTPQGIDPLPYELAYHIPFTGESEARVKYIGTSIRGNLIFEFQIKENGVKQRFSNSRSIVGPDELPITIFPGGSKVLISNYDKETKSVDIKVLKPLPSSEYSIYSSTNYYSNFY